MIAGYGGTNDGEHPCVELTEERAAATLAMVWNALTTGALEALLAPDVTLTSQEPPESCTGRQNVLGKIAFDMHLVVEGLPQTRVYAELGWYSRRPCVLLAVGEKDPPVAVVFMTCADGRITRIEYCSRAPLPFHVQRTGVYPDASALTGAGTASIRGQRDSTSNAVQFPEMPPAPCGREF